MDEDAALQAARTAGLTTLLLGSALIVAPGRVGPLGGFHDRRTARLVGVVDLVLAPGLVSGSPRWPWLAARAVANVATAAVAVRGGWSGRGTAASLLAVTVVDARAVKTLLDARR